MLGGRCIAGKELISNKPARWIRVVGKVGENGGVPWRQFTPIRLLDIIDLPLDKPVPNEHQPGEHQKENWLLDTTARPLWEGGNRSWNAIAKLVDYPVEQLWINGYDTKHGKNDFVPYCQIRKMKVNSSLRFIRVEELTLSTQGRKVLGHFQHNGEEYLLKVTDPDYKTPNSKGFARNKKNRKFFLTVSLAGRLPPIDICSKLIAAIILCDKINGI